MGGYVIVFITFGMMAFHGRRGVGHAVVRENDDIHNVRHVGHIQPLSQVLHSPVQLHHRQKREF